MRGLRWITRSMVVLALLASFGLVAVASAQSGQQVSVSVTLLDGTTTPEATATVVPTATAVPTTAPTATAEPVTALPVTGSGSSGSSVPVIVIAMVALFAAFGAVVVTGAGRGDARA